MRTAALHGSAEGNGPTAAAAEPCALQHAAGAALVAAQVSVLLAPAPAAVASFAPVIPAGGADPVAAWQARPSRRASRPISSFSEEADSTPVPTMKRDNMRLSLALCARLQAAQLMAACGGDVGVLPAALGHAPPPPSGAEEAGAALLRAPCTYLTAC